MAKNRPRHGSAFHLTPAFGLFRPSKDLVLKNIWIFAPLYVVPLILALHNWIWAPTAANPAHHWWGHLGTPNSSLALAPTPNYAGSAFIGFSLVWFLLVIVGGTVVQIMLQQAQLEVAEGGSPTFGGLWNTVKKMLWRMLGVYILSGIFIVIGLVLFIVPGLIMIRRYFLASYVMLDKQPPSAMEALRISARMTKPTPNSSDWSISSRGIWGIVGVMILFGLVGVIPFLGTLISLALAMLYSVAPALRYQELKKLGS